MQNRHLQNKPFIYFLIWSFLLLISAETLPAAEIETGKTIERPVIRVKAARGPTSAQQAEFDRLMEEGKRLYHNMDNEAAIQKFLKARQSAISQKQISELYFYLSLAYFGSVEEGRSSEFINALTKLIEVDFHRQLDTALCPQRFIDMFEEIKKDYGVIKINSIPHGADVYINNSRTSAGLTPLTLSAKAGEVKLEIKKGKQKKKASLRIEAGKEIQSPVYELKGGSSMIFILGGALLGGGAIAALALGGGGNGNGGGGGGGGTVTTGTISVSSTPSGALVYLDGTQQGTTPTTISNVSAGSHTVSVVKEGYLDHEETVTVNAGQTVTVNATLGNHVINISQPQENSEWILGEGTMEIRWSMEGSSSLGTHKIATMSWTHTKNALGVARHTRERTRRIACSSGYSSSRLSRMNRSAVAQDPRSRIQQTLTNPGLAAGLTSDALRVNHSSPLNHITLANSQEGDLHISSLNNVRIDLLKSGNVVLNIVESTENDGVYDWTIPVSLEAGSDYKIRIASTVSSEVNFTSNRFILKEPTFVPTAPINLKIEDCLEKSPGSMIYNMFISWKDKSDNEKGFKVERMLQLDPFVDTKWITIADLAANKKTFTDTGLTSEGVYNYRVLAYNDDGDSGYSNEAGRNIFNYPTNLQAASLPGPKAGLSWNDNSSLETGYIIWRRMDSGTWGSIGSAKTDVTYFEDSDVAIGHTYYYQIQAYKNIPSGGGGFLVWMSSKSSTVSISFN